MPNYNLSHAYFLFSSASNTSQWERRKTQALLCKVVTSLLAPGTTVYSNYRSKEISSLENSQRALELDVYVPSFRLALEFQGIFHYDHNHQSGPVSFFGDATAQQKRDQRKREECEVVL